MTQETARCANCLKLLYRNSEGKWAHQHGGSEQCKSGANAVPKPSTIRKA
jgi:hypothetical protein